MSALPESSENLIVYRSSAGSGKTYTLVKAYLGLALSSTNPLRFRSILAMTFTNKAASEMKERILLALQVLSSSPGDKDYNENFVNDIKQVVGVSSEELKKRAAATKSAILHNYADLGVSTLDSFSHRVIRSFAKDLDVAMDFEIQLNVDEQLQKAIDLLIAKVGHDDFVSKVLVEYAHHKAEDEKSWHVERDIMEVAKVLTFENSQPHIARLHGLKDEDFEEVRKIVFRETDAFQKKVVDFASKAYALIKQKNLEPEDFYYGTKGIYNYFKKLADGELEIITPNSYVKKTIEQDKWASGKISSSAVVDLEEIKSELEKVYKEIDRCREEDHSFYCLLKVIQKNLYSLSVLRQVEQIITDIKMTNNMLFISDFNEKISHVVMQESAPFIYERLGDRYKNFLIDEFQDTSVLQWQNLLPLIENSLAFGNYNLLVGDGKQAIYRWRNGEVEQFAQLPQIYRHRNNPVLLEKEDILKRNYTEQVLGKNYRSRKEIVEFNNQLFKNLGETLAEEHQTIYETLYQESLSSKEGGFVKVEVFPKAGAEEYRDYTLKKLISTIESLLSEGFKQKDIAILIRTNKVSNEVAGFLINNGYDVISPDSLLLGNSPQVRFLINFLTIVYDNENEPAKLEVIKYLLEHKAGSEDLAQVLKKYLYELSDRRKRLDIKNFLKDHQVHVVLEKYLQQPVYQTVEDLVSLFNMPVHQSLYLQFFLDVVHDYSSSRGNMLSGFLEYWQENENKFNVKTPEGADAIQVMTIHKSKGLQFPVVIAPFANWKFRMGNETLWLDFDEGVSSLTTALVGLNKSLEQTPYAAEFKSEESRILLDNINLLYVALTRPEERLYLWTEDLPKNKKSSGSRISDYIVKEVERMTGYDGAQMVLERGVLSSPEKKEVKEQNVISLEETEKYEWRQRLKISLESEKLWDSAEVASRTSYGKLLHAALAEIKTHDDVNNAIEKLIDEGMAGVAEAEQLKDKLKLLLNHEEVSKFFRAGLNIRSEAEIITEKGEIYRPDRIILDQNKAIIIDFKTGQKEKQHEKQIRKYGKLLEDMDYEEVEKLLIYTEKIAIEKVE